MKKLNKYKASLADLFKAK